jgi:hypothetical protein
MSFYDIFTMNPCYYNQDCSNSLSQNSTLRALFKIIHKIKSIMNCDGHLNDGNDPSNWQSSVPGTICSPVPTVNIYVNKSKVSLAYK